ncbi:unnamed protein product [Rotaria sp. Silwood1]|nr:unnamed protein product [Rotaria sp. Silwood1]CAF4886227.1 unnamed protein product [Rotaria sp. Silwood1]
MDPTSKDIDNRCQVLLKHIVDLSLELSAETGNKQLAKKMFILSQSLYELNCSQEGRKVANIGISPSIFTLS